MEVIEGMLNQEKTPKLVIESELSVFPSSYSPVSPSI